jgi:hypothetical protein
MTQAARWHKDEQVSGMGDSGADVDLVFETVPNGRYRRYERIGGVDNDNDFTQITILASSGGSEFLRSAQATCIEDLLYWDPYPNTLTEGQALVVRFTGTTDDDDLEAYASYFEGPLGDV